jgi:hypothetical protein
LHCRAAIVIIIALLITPGLSRGQAADSGDTLSTEPALAPNDSSSVTSLGMLMLQMDNHLRSTTSLSFYSRPDINRYTMFGYEVYRASPYECALQGAGMGMSLGMAAGAFGMMTGAWDERRAWYIAGATAAAGALFGTAKSDDPGWSIRLRPNPGR